MKNDTPLSIQMKCYALTLNLSYMCWKWCYCCNDCKYRKVASSRPVYYSILDPFVKRSQYINIQNPLHKQSEKANVCY